MRLVTKTKEGGNYYYLYVEFKNDIEYHHYFDTLGYSTYSFKVSSETEYVHERFNTKMLTDEELSYAQMLDKIGM